MSDFEVKRLSDQMAKSQLLEADFSSRLATLCDSQRLKFRHFIMKLHENQLLTNGENMKEKLGEKGSEIFSPPSQKIPKKPKMEESYTIHLGAQMKTMHNLRLIAINSMQLCRNHLDSRLNKIFELFKVARLRR